MSTSAVKRSHAFYQLLFLLIKQGFQGLISRYITSLGIENVGYFKIILLQLPPLFVLREEFIKLAAGLREFHAGSIYSCQHSCQNTSVIAISMEVNNYEGK